MSNVKLVDDLWASEGVYDTAQDKTQKAINAVRIESGKVYTNAMSAYTWGSTASRHAYITFSKAFASPPTVTVTQIVSNGSQIGSIPVGVNGITTTGFYVFYGYQSINNTADGISWIAVGT